MDADLQDDPKETPAMIATLKDGIDLVSGWKKDTIQFQNHTIQILQLCYSNSIWDKAT